MHQALQAELDALEQQRVDTLPDQVVVDPYGAITESDVEGMDDGELGICFSAVPWPFFYGFQSFGGNPSLPIMLSFSAT